MRLWRIQPSQCPITLFWCLGSFLLDASTSGLLLEVATSPRYALVNWLKYQISSIFYTLPDTLGNLDLFISWVSDFLFLGSNLFNCFCSRFRRGGRIDSRLFLLSQELSSTCARSRAIRCLLFNSSWFMLPSRMGYGYLGESSSFGRNSNSFEAWKQGIPHACLVSELRLIISSSCVLLRIYD